MQKIPFPKKFITCVLAALVIGASALRIGVTFFRTWVPIGKFSIIPFVAVAAAAIYAFIWQSRKTDNPATLAFWQGLIRYGVAFDLADFGWEKVFHLQLVMPLSKLDLPYSSFTPSDIFWTFFSHSYLFGCIIAGLQIVGAMLLLFRRTTLVGVFILLAVLGNILLMDIFYQIGSSVVVHASIMMAGVLYFVVIEFNRLRAFFFSATSSLSVLPFSKSLKLCIRLSIIYIPLLLIMLFGPFDRNPQLTGKYKVEELRTTSPLISKNYNPDSLLTVVYFDVRNGCVFEFKTPQNRWNGTYRKENDRIEITWRTPADKPFINGVLSGPNDSGKLNLTGLLGTDSMSLTLQKIRNF